jgi:hypothetical protein
LASGLSKVKVAVWASSSTLTFAAPIPAMLALSKVRSAACRVTTLVGSTTSMAILTLATNDILSASGVKATS